MDMLDQTLDSGDDKGDSNSQIELSEDGNGDGITTVPSGTLTIDANGQYRLTTDAGQVTYRVVQVAQGDDVQSHMISALPTPTQVIPSFTVASTEDMDTKLTYISSVSSAGDGPATATLDASGQYFVMMSPQDVLQAAGQRVIAPRMGLVSNSGLGGGTKATRDDRRRASHNEVERRRRDKINNWIVQLSKLIPNCDIDINKAGQISKGGILSKACDFINDIRSSNAQLAEALKDSERVNVEIELLRQQVEELKQENALLRSQLSQHGVLVPDLSQ